MKINSKKEAKQLAKAYSFNKDYICNSIYVILNTRTKDYHVSTNRPIRKREKVVGYYYNGIYTVEKSYS